MLITYRIAFSV